MSIGVSQEGSDKQGSLASGVAAPEAAAAVDGTDGTPRTNGESTQDSARLVAKPETNGATSDAALAPPTGDNDASEQVSATSMTGLAVPSEPITESAKAVAEPTSTNVEQSALPDADSALAKSEQADVAVEHTVSVDAPTSDLREEHAPAKNPAETNGSASAELKHDSLAGESSKSAAANGPQSPISPPQERSEHLAEVATKPENVSAPTPPQSTAASPRPETEDPKASSHLKAESKPDTDMLDAPASGADSAAADSATTKHERTEDADDQPSKRPRTDDGSGSASPSVKFSETDAARKMTPNRQKYAITVLRQLKRSKDSAPFMQPVDPVKLKIPDYFKIVTNPQDLGTIEAKLKKNEYDTIDQFSDAVELVWSNCQKYNGSESPINLMALRLKESFERQMRSMPPAEVAEPTPVGRVSKAKKTGKGSGSPTATRPRNASGSATPSGVPAIRRESMGVDGRPKREIHAPPPKSLPYQNATQKKGRNVKQLKFCASILKELTNKKHEQYAFPFYQPVDAVALGLHDYHTIIKKPMDLSTMQQKLNAGEYESADDFEYDMRLMFRNCYKYNGQGTPVNAMGKSLENVFMQKWVEKPLIRPAGASDSEDESDNDTKKEQTVEMLKKQLKVMEERIKTIDAAKSNKKSKKSYYDDDDGGMGPRDTDYVASSAKKGRKRRDSNVDADESPMFPTFEQKSELSQKMSYMTEHQMPVVVQILKRMDPSFDPEDDEVELDVDKIHPKTIRLLWNWIINGQEPSFLKKKAAKAKKNRSVLSESEQARQIQQLEAQLQKFDGGAAYGSRYADNADDESNDSDASSEEDD